MLVWQVTMFFSLITVLFVGLSSSSATFLACYSTLGLRLRLPLFHACQNVSRACRRTVGGIEKEVTWHTSSTAQGGGGSFKNRKPTPKRNLSQEISALTSEHLSWTCLLYCACHANCIFADPLQPSFLEMLQNPHVLLTFDKVHNPFCLPCKTTSERPKVLRAPQSFALLT